MLIKRFTLPTAVTEVIGLSEIKMSRLGRIVAIAGKNGSGKSRLLTLLDRSVSQYGEGVQQKENWASEIKNLKNAIENNPTNRQVPTWEQLISSFQIKIDESNYVNSDNTNAFKALKFVPKTLVLADPQMQPQNQLFALHAAAKTSGIENFSSNCIAYIQQVQNLWWSTSHQLFSGSSNEKEVAAREYASLKDLVSVLMNAQLDRSSTDETTIFGKPIAKSGLSDGQKIILQMAAAIHAQSGSLNNTVFILDELENHLHPSVTIDILEKISAVAPNAQIWIATHSVPLLAYIASIDPMALWYMEAGKITHAGRHPERVLSSLLGCDDRIGQLSSFTGLPAQLAATNYAVESLLPPLTLAAEERDPQINQIAKVLHSLNSQSIPVVMDFGAGRGRLLEGLAAITETGTLSQHINYLAFDNSDKDKDVCISIISEHFIDPNERHFSDNEDFFSRKNNGSVDVIVMCNVLHEIPPSDWPQILARDSSLLQRALKDTGYLLLVEDQRIPVGEKAHEHGFLVLDTAQLRTLFNVAEVDIAEKRFISNDYRNDGRLKAHLIAKPLLARLTSETRTKAISELRDTSLDRIRHIRGQEPNYANGQLHGFWTQQLANAYMYTAQN